MEKLLENVKETQSHDFVISRELDAPRALVFKAWTEKEQLEQWWGPKGMDLQVTHLDLRPGGTFLYYIALPGDQKMWGRFVYSSIVSPERLVYISAFSDDNGGITRAPFSPTWPLEVHNTLTFSEQNGKTTLTLRSQALHATAEERKTFEDAFASLQQGFSGTLDQLDAYLAKQKSESIA